MAQLHCENLKVVPSTADGFKPAVTEILSLGGEDGVIIHTFTLP